MSETQNVISLYKYFSSNRGTEMYKYEGMLKYFIDTMKETLVTIVRLPIMGAIIAKYNFEGFFISAATIGLTPPHFKLVLGIILTILVLIEYVVLGNFNHNRQKMLLTNSNIRLKYKIRYDGYIKPEVDVELMAAEVIWNCFQIINPILQKYKAIPYMAFLAEIFVNKVTYFGPYTNLFVAYAAFTIISDAFKLYGLYNYIFNHYFVIKYNNEILTWHEDSLTFLDKMQQPHKLSFSNLFFPELDHYEFFIRDEVNEQRGGSKEGEFYVGLVKHFFKAIFTNIKILFLLLGYKIVETTKSIASYIIPDFIKDFYYGNIDSDTELEELKEILKNKLIIKSEDENKLRKIIDKYKFKDILNKENVINIDKLYKKMLDIEDNEDFLTVHKINLESKLGQLKNKNDWRVISSYKKILLSRKLDKKR